MVDMAYQVFVDLDATALEGGSISLGQPDADPEQSPIAVFWDEAQTIQAPQPLRTSGGVIVRDGTPADVFASVPAYSIRVRNRAGSVVWYKATTGGTAASRLTFPIPAGPPGADSTVPGPADNTYTTLAALLASDPARKSARLVPGTGETAPAGNFNYVNGAWVRQLANGVTYDARQSVQGKLDRVVLATDARFGGGAVASPNVDNLLALQAGIDALFAAGGGTLLLPFGTFGTSFTPLADGGVGCLTLKPGVAIRGQDKFGSVIRVMDNAGFGPGTYFRGIATNGRTPKAGLSNFTFDGNCENQGNQRDSGNGGNIVLDCSEVAIDGIRSINANGQGIQLRGGPTNPMEVVSVTNCYVANCKGSTINADGSVAAEFNGNGIGIQIGYAKDVIVTGNTVRSCKDNAIDTYNESGSFDAVGGGILISGNILRSCRVGIFPETSSRVTVSNNKIEDMAEAGIALNRINSAPSEVMIRGNTIRTTLVGIRVSGNMESANIEDNFISNITSVNGGCIGLYTASNILIRGNTFKPNNPNIPHVRTGDSQAVYINIGENYFYGTPNTDRMIVRGAADHTGFNVFGPFIPVDNGGMVPVGEGGTMVRNNVRFSTAQIVGAFGANGAVPQLAYVVPAPATDAASAVTLANALRNLVIANGTGKAS